MSNLQFEFVIDDPAVPADTFQVVSFEGFEQVNQTFQFTVDLVSDDPDISLSELAFKPATLEVYRDDQQLIFHGLVAHFEQGLHVGQRYTYRTIFVPPMWFLSLYFNTRIFIERTVPEIIEEVLQEVGFTSQHYELRLNASYPICEYLAQYQETDLNFVCRLCEREGIRFSVHADDGKILFSDEITSESNLIEQVLVYNPGGGLGAAAEAVRTFTSREKVTSDEMTLRDYNYRTASATHEVLEATEGSIQLAEGSPWQGDWLSHYEYGLHHQDQGNTDRLTTVRLEEIACQRQVMSGTSGYVGLRAGHILTVEGHFRNDLNGDFFLTRITHQGTQGASVPGMSQQEAQNETAYSNEFDSIPADVQYRPPRITPVPKVPGIMTGVIESAGGDYAHLDEEGRYRVRMHFDKGDAPTAEATHWIRMKQAYSGPEYGIHFPNHEGTEMVWACVDGDPDRPMALGTAPNPSQKSPVTSENKWQSVIRTWGRNELTFDDKVGEENIYLFATKDHNRVVTNDETISVGHDRTKTVGNDEMNTIHNNRTTHVEEGDEFLWVLKGDRTVQIEEGDDTLFVMKGDSVVSVFEGDENTYVNKDAILTVDGDWLATVKMDVDVQSTDSQIHLTAATEIVLEVGQSKIAMYSDGTIEINGLNIAINGTESVSIHGGSVTSKADVDHTTEGTIVLSDGAATNTVKGGMVMLNP